MHGRRIIVAICAAIVIGALAGSAPAVAADGWSASSDLWSGSGSATDPVMAAAPDGSAVVAWVHTPPTGPSAIVAVRIAADGAVSEPATLPLDGTASSLAVSIGDEGTATLAWVAAPSGSAGPVAGAQLGVQTGFSAALDLGRGDRPRVASAADGTALVTWQSANREDVGLAGIEPGRAPQVRRSTLADGSGPDVAARPGGGWSLVFTRSDPAPPSNPGGTRPVPPVRVWLADLAADVGPASPVKLPATWTWAARPRLKIARDGTRIVAWDDAAGPHGAWANSAELVRVRADGDLAPPGVTRFVNDAELDLGALDVDAAGSATLLWAGWPHGLAARGVGRLARVGATATSATVADLPYGADEASAQGALLSGPDATVTLVWCDATGSIQAMRVRDGFGAGLAILGQVPAADRSQPAAGAGPGSRIWAAWRDAGGARVHVQWARYGPGAPEPPRLTLAGLSLTRTRFAAAGADTPRSAVARGTVIRFRLSRAATVTLRFSKLTARPPRPGRAPPRTIARQGRAGANAVRFTGRIGHSALTPGRWRVTLAAAAPPDTAAPQSRTFTVLPG